MDSLSRNSESYRLSLYETQEVLSETELYRVEKVLCTLDGNIYVRRTYADDKRALFEELAKIDCPWIPKIKEVFLTTDTIVIEEFIAGRTAADLVTDGTLSKARAESCADCLLQALAALHAHGIIHRDVKPDNIIIAPDGGARLIDFGIARFYRENENSDTEKFGTAGYAAPEQYGFGQSDARTDLYAAGVTLLRLCEAAGLRGPVKATALKCSKFDPQGRFKSANEALRYLRFRRRLPYCAAACAVVIMAVCSYRFACKPQPISSTTTEATVAVQTKSKGAAKTITASNDLAKNSSQNAAPSSDSAQNQPQTEAGSVGAGQKTSSSTKQQPRQTTAPALSKTVTTAGAKPNGQSQQKNSLQPGGGLIYPSETDALIVTQKPQPALLLLQRGRRSQTGTLDLNGAKVRAYASMQNSVLNLSLDDGRGHVFKHNFSLNDERPLASRDYQTSDTDAEVLFCDLDGDGRTEIFPALSNRKYEPIADQKGYLVNSIAAWCVRYSPTAGFSLDKTQMTDESPRQLKIKDHKIWLSQGLEAYILSNGELKPDKQ